MIDIFNGMIVPVPPLMPSKEDFDPEKLMEYIQQLTRFNQDLLDRMRQSGNTNLGISNVTNTEQMPLSYLDTDGTLAANSDVRVASQKATKTYANTKVISPATNTDNNIPQWDGVNSKTLKDGVEKSTDGTLADNSDTAVPTEKAVKTYADTKLAGTAAAGGDLTGNYPNPTIGTGKVITTALKTTTGEITTDISTGIGGEFGVICDYNRAEEEYATKIDVIGRDGGSGENVTLPGGTYAFFPQTKRVTVTGYWQTRYVTASGQDHWLFLKIDKITKDIISAYSAPDHPAYGNGGDFDKLPHPFKGYDDTRYEIVLVDNDTIAELKTQITEEKSLLTLVNELYRPNMSKTETYKPLHSGKFLGQEPELVQSIPDYIKVRKLIPMTIQERLDKKQRQEDKIQETQQARQIIRDNLRIKLDLTEEEFNQLRKNI